MPTEEDLIADFENLEGYVKDKIRQIKDQRREYRKNVRSLKADLENKEIKKSGT
jgi:hypothetical protein